VRKLVGKGGLSLPAGILNLAELTVGRRSPGCPLASPGAQARSPIARTAAQCAPGAPCSHSWCFDDCRISRCGLRSIDRYQEVRLPLLSRSA
jgi:hypothetical protein